MPFDSNGTFNRVILGGWKADAAAGIRIRADRHDDEDDGFATGLSTCITKDGRTQPQADIPMNGKHIIALADPRDGFPQDAATKNYVDNYKAFTTGLSITGAGPINGMINFTSPVGVNGIGWTTADMSWIGRINEANKYMKLLAVNDKPDGTGTDVVRVNEAGHITSTSGAFGNNISYDGTQWRTVGTGIGTLVTVAGGAITYYSQDVASTIEYQPAAIRQWYTAYNNNGSTQINLAKTASGKSIDIYGLTGGAQRWRMVLGSADPESSTASGSHFYLQSFANDGATPTTEIIIARDTHLMTIGGSFTSPGNITSGGYFISSGQNMVIGNTTGNGSIYFRPHVHGDVWGQMVLDYNGNLQICSLATAPTGGLFAGKGLGGKAGMNGGYEGYFHNLAYSGGFEYVYVNDTLMGAITWQSDYRIKRNVRPLGTMWEKIKSLNPVSYNHAKFREFTEDDDTERWGMLAHELQEKLTHSAAIGEKDGDNVIQSVNPLTLITALTRALQEAMARIEALEARVPA